MNPIKRWLSDAKSQPSLKYVDTCDGLRTMAVLIVAWFHIWQQSWLFPGLTILGCDISLDPLVRSGYIWVDMMILISGFCLYLPWVRMRHEGGAPMKPLDFYARRFVRIHPSYLLTIAIMFAVALATNAYYYREHMVRDLVSHLTYTHMFFYDAYYASNLGGALWTLAIEMQFYLLFPLIARAFYKLPTTTFTVMVAIALSFRGWVSVNVKDVALYFNQLPAYLDTFSCIFQGIIPYGAQMLVAVSVAANLGCNVSAFEVIPNLIYPYMLLVSSLIFVFIIPERNK